MGSNNQRSSDAEVRKETALFGCFCVDGMIMTISSAEFFINKLCN
jgi:hypothetical protein